MSLSALKGAVGVGFQSAKGVPAANIHYFPVLNAGITGEQMSQTVPPEVGGSYFSRGSYKAGLRSRGEVSLIPRPNSIGWLLKSLFKGELVAPSGIRNKHAFTVGDDALTPQRWLTVRRMVNNAYGEEMLDARVGTFRLDIAAAGLVQASVSFLGGDHAEILGADVFVEDAPVFLTCITDVSSGGAPFIVDRLTIEMGAQLTDNEFRVGSYFLDDITLLQRMVQISADVRLKSRDLFSKVYRNGAAAPASGARGKWSPTIYRSDLRVQMLTGEATQPQALELIIPGLDFLTFPVQEAGADLIRAQLTAQVTLGADNNNAQGTLQPITVNLLNDEANGYDHSF